MVVLLVLTVGVATLQSVANYSFVTIEESRERQHDLQRRWGRASCEKVLLAKAPAIFENAALPTVVREEIALGDQSFTMLLADEDAKLNLNWLYHQRGKPAVAQTIRRLMPPMFTQAVELQPAIPSSNQKRAGADRSIVNFEVGRTPEAFRSFGEVFNLPRLSQITGDDRILAAVSNELTLWSSGGINVRRASDAVLTEAIEVVVTDGLAKRLVMTLRKSPLTPLDIVLEKEVENVSDRKSLQQVLRRRSTHFSLWTEVTSKTSRSQYLAVLGVDRDGLPRRRSFALN
jgi:hypothetical protein